MIKKSTSRVVVLGSASFIARCVIKKLKNKKFLVKEVSRKEIDFYKKNETLRLKKIIKYGDSIFFAAAKAPVKNINMFNYNLSICKNIIESIQNIQIKHFTYLSSDAVYKDSKRLINEESPAEPESLHGLMHLSREKILENLKTKGLLEKMRYGTKGNIQVPAMRNDVMHNVDLVEDVAAAYGYSNMEAIPITTHSVGGTTPLQNFADDMRALVVGCGYQEIFSAMLTNPKSMTICQVFLETT